jgi:molybdopterin-guanine dinucleotide biosynthesis protein A
MDTHQAAGFLLAGGRSSRMGSNKAFLTLGGELLVQRGIRKLSEVCSDVAIAGGGDDMFQFGRVVQDQAPGRGPLGGIVSALGQSAFEWNLFLPVDAPFVPVEALKRLLATAAGSAGVCVMARAGGRMQPLCAVYSKRALGGLEQELTEGRWKVLPAIEATGQVAMVDFEDASWFLNLNTPEEFAEAKHQISERGTT